MKTFRVVTTISLVLTLTIAVLSIIGVVITGFYPGIIVLVSITIVPVIPRLYATKMKIRTGTVQPYYYTALTFINLLSILVVLWMAFVIVYDRVLQDCC